MREGARLPEAVAACVAILEVVPPRHRRDAGSMAWHTRATLDDTFGRR